MEGRNPEWEEERREVCTAMEGWGAEAPSDIRGFPQNSKGGGREKERELGPQGARKSVCVGGRGVTRKETGWPNYAICGVGSLGRLQLAEVKGTDNVLEDSETSPEVKRPHEICVQL